MIRRLEDADIDRVIDIWLETNLKTHSFISPEYWKSNLEMVREMLPQGKSMYRIKTDKYWVLRGCEKRWVFTALSCATPCNLQSAHLQALFPSYFMFQKNFTCSPAAVCGFLCRPTKKLTLQIATRAVGRERYFPWVVLWQ